MADVAVAVMYGVPLLDDELSTVVDKEEVKESVELNWDESVDCADSVVAVDKSVVLTWVVSVGCEEDSELEVVAKVDESVMLACDVSVVDWAEPVLELETKDNAVIVGEELASNDDVDDCELP